MDIIYRDLKPENILLDREVFLDEEKEFFLSKWNFLLGTYSFNGLWFVQNNVIDSRT